MNTTMGNSHQEMGMELSAQEPNMRFLVYENLKYIGESAFYKESILIGKSRNADLVLDHQTVADVHALVQIQQGQAFITNKNPGNGLRLNGLKVKKSEILTEDVIQLGPYSIIFKHDSASLELTQPADDFSAAGAPETEKTETPVPNRDTTPKPSADAYSIVLVNQYPSAMSRKRAIENLAKLLGVRYAKVDRVMQKPRHLLKKDLDWESAERLENSLRSAGVLCLVESADGTVQLSTSPPAQATTIVSTQPTSSSKHTLQKEAAPDDFDQIVGAVPTHTPDGVDAPQPEAFLPGDERDEGPQLAEVREFTLSGPLMIDDDDEDDDEPYDAPFSLKSELTRTPTIQNRAQRLPAQVYVTKILGETVLDAYCLNSGQKYYAHGENGRFCLAEFNSRQEAYAYVRSDSDGYLTDGDNRRTGLGVFRSEEYLSHRRKQIYRIPLSKSETAFIYDGQCRYAIHLAESEPSPEVQVPMPAKTMDWRHWAYSAGTHLFFLVCLSIYIYFQGVAHHKQLPHFVKIDLATLKALEAKKEVVPPPKIEPPAPKPEPVRVAEKVTPPEKKAPEKAPPPPPAKMAKKSHPQKKVANAQVSRHPNAGGGFGEGNIANRNVNQTGILSILGKNAVPGPSAAIASVTNIDAVKVPGATGKNFTVGGIKGSVGTGKIAMGTSGGIVETKGSTQVLRSAGASGPGTVAALEKGSIGKSQVKGMVTAKMTRTVKIEGGGMSREMVKRVIDQHMGEITYCYESALVGNPSISGRAIFEWKIKMDGSVGEIRIVASTINSHQVHDCIKNAIRSWQFPNPVGSEVMVSYPFVFDLVAF